VIDEQNESSGCANNNFNNNIIYFCLWFLILFSACKSVPVQTPITISNPYSANNEADDAKQSGTGIVDEIRRLTESGKLSCMLISSLLDCTATLVGIGVTDHVLGIDQTWSFCVKFACGCVVKGEEILWITKS